MIVFILLVLNVNYFYLLQKQTYTFLIIQLDIVFVITK